mgnify:CR=1 FL=1
MSTLVMGVVNVTTDSFSDGGRYLDTGAAISHGLALWAAGADILDVGGESTRPGAERVDPSIERDRVVPVIRALAQRGAWISIDTMNASTALAAVDSGARIVNDVSGGLADAAMLPAVAETDAEIILGHWRGPSREMYAPAQYADVAAEVTAELAERVAAARDAGIGADRIIVDPGIGFGKRPEQNWEVLRALPQLVAAGLDQPDVLLNHCGGACVGVGVVANHHRSGWTKCHRGDGADECGRRTRDGRDVSETRGCTGSRRNGTLHQVG